jgi:small-conductance mechanosensitive channel
MNHVTWLGIIGGALIVVAGALRLRHRADSGRAKIRLRRTVVLFVPYAVLGGLATYGHLLGDGLWLSVARIAADFLALLLTINLIAVALFDVALKIVRLHAPDILHDLAIGAMYALALVWLMHRSGVNLASIVATSAVATAVIGLSLQSTLGSIIGGLALQVDDSLTAGDWVELENKTQGQVKQIRWRHTVIETRDWDTLIVPNNQLLNQTIKVLGKRGGQTVPHRMWVHFHVDFRTPLHEVIGTVDDALHAAPIEGVAADPRPSTVCLDLAREHGQSSVHYASRYWLTDLARDDPTSSAVRERIFAALKRRQIPLAIPAMAVFVANDDATRAQRKERRQKTHVRAGLKRVALFSGLAEEELEDLAKSVVIAPFAAGELVTRQGAKANWLYVLVDGQVEVTVTTPEGETKHVGTLSAPDFFGEMALMTGAVREATVLATTDIECLRVDRSVFGTLLEHRPEIAREVALILAERRVMLDAVRENLDAESLGRRVEGERNRILNAVQSFFGLKD